MNALGSPDSSETPAACPPASRAGKGRPELLAPAGDLTCLQAALDAGADAVYLGLERFNMRRMATRNFTRGNLPEASRRCRARGARLYLTLNCIVYEDELADLAEVVTAAAPHIDAAIVSDWAVFELCARQGIPVHVSTQMSVSNSAAARRLHELGAKRIVLARECTLAEVQAIRRAVPVELEAFVHGAMCVSVSGRCLLSHEAYGLSCNRGECRQPCRREFEVREVAGEDAAFVIGSGYVLSPRDLCSLPFLDELIAAGLDAFKIEGRSRNAEYVHTVVGAYREAIDAVRAGAFDAARREALVERCRAVFNREFSVGHYFGRPTPGDFTSADGNAATRQRQFVGRVLNYYKSARVAMIAVQDTPFRVGDTLMVRGSTTGIETFAVSGIRREQEVLDEAPRGWVTLPVPVRVRTGDKVFRVRASDVPARPAHEHQRLAGRDCNDASVSSAVVFPVMPSL